jgi:tripartite-type tricarboxylate transporter receptor subunit TctC
MCVSRSRHAKAAFTAIKGAADSRVLSMLDQPRLRSLARRRALDQDLRPERETRIRNRDGVGDSDLLSASSLAATIVSTCWEASAQSPADYYKGKVITFVLGSEGGSGYETHTRLLARHMGRHIPGNPSVIVQNMPGASSIRAANYVNNIAPKDGTVIAAVQRTVPFEPLFGNSAVQYDVHKINWLGNTAKEIGLVVVWHKAPHQIAADIFKYPMIVGGAGPATGTEMYARALNTILGAKMRIVSGYQNMAPLNLALERGEIEGIANWSWSSVQNSQPGWLKEGKIRLLMHMGLQDIPERPEVPSVLTLTRNTEESQIFEVLMYNSALGRPFFLAPGVPEDRVKAMQSAFMATVADKDFIDDATRLKVDIDPHSGAEVRDIVLRAYSSPEAVIVKARAAIQP